MDSRKKGALVTFLVLALAALTIATSAYGQTTSALSATPAAAGAAGNRTLGLMLGVHSVGAQGVTLSGAEFDQPYKLNSGFGAGVTIGYGFNRTFSSYVSFDVAKQRTHEDEAIEGTYGLGHLEFGVRANLPLGLVSTVPYVTGSIGRRGLAAKATDYETGETSDVAFHGRMIGLGAGIEHFISRNMSLDGGVQLAFGKFDHLTQDGEDYDLALDGTRSVRLRIGVTWRP